jgi:probable phosphomutase (TIGR03848 family)
MVRHGETPTTGKVLPGRAAGLHLSAKGKQQAAEVGRHLAKWTSDAADGQKPLTIAAVYTSPMERARETAGAISIELGAKPTVHRGLNECDFGDWTGRSLKELAKQPEWKTVQRWPSGFTFPGGESFMAMQARMLQALAQIRAAHPGEAVVVVSHADTIKAAVADALGTHLDHFQRIVISPCSLTMISYGPAGPQVLCVNAKP